MSKPGVLSRSVGLFGGCTMVFLLALLLRIRSQWDEDHVILAGPAPATALTQLAKPRDYVLDPQVAPGERSRGPARIVSLAPSVTETLCALGLLDHLVGRTQFCSYPPAVAGVRVIGGLSDPNLELISNLEPDLVMTTDNSGSVNRVLASLGLRHASLPHEGLAEVFTAIEQAGRACDRPETARALCAALRADLDRLSAEARDLHRRPLRVLVVTGELPIPPAAVWAAGPGSFFDDLLRLSGHANAAADVLRSSVGTIPLEKLVVLDPDVILTFPEEPPTAQHMTDLYRSWTKVGPMRAIREQRVRGVGDLEWLSAGPRAALELHRFITVLSEFR